MKRCLEPANAALVVIEAHLTKRGTVVRLVFRKHDDRRINECTLAIIQKENNFGDMPNVSTFETMKDESSSILTLTGRDQITGAPQR
jgi:hypothetical protein